MARDNPLGIEGFGFIEFASPDPGALVRLFEGLGFHAVAEDDARRIATYRQRDITFVLNDEAGGFATGFAAAHGPCASAIAFRVKDAARAFEQAVARGARPYDGTAGRKLIEAPALVGIGDSCLYLVDAGSPSLVEGGGFAPTGERPGRGVGLNAVDHLTHNVVAGNREAWVDFYRDVFGFEVVFDFETRGKATGFKTTAVMAPTGDFRITVNEPTERTSQIQAYIDAYRGEGIQHIALNADDLYRSVSEIAEGGAVSFLPTPQTYYDQVDARLPGHREDLAAMRRLGLLIDGVEEAGHWQLLLQIFTREAIGPIFFEFIQRKGNQGFGEGNAQALFEAIEAEQIARGAVNG